MIIILIKKKNVLLEEENETMMRYDGEREKRQKSIANKKKQL